MDDNGRRFPPTTLPALIAGELLAIGRTRLYLSLADGSIPSVQGAGRARKVPTAWVAAQLCLKVEELVERLPEEAWR